MKKIILAISLLASLLTSFQAYAGEKINVTVKGMVCSFCSQGITKKIQALPEVASVKVNLDIHIVTIETKEGAVLLKDESITKVLSDAGYSVAKISR